MQRKFREITVFVQKRVQDERTNEKWGEIALGVAIGAACVLVIASGVGAFVGFGAVLTWVTGLAGTTTAVGLASAVGARVVRERNIFEQVLNNLTELKQILTQMSQQYADMRGYQDQLTTARKNEFLGLLNRAVEEVSRGFNILKKF